MTMTYFRGLLLLFGLVTTVEMNLPDVANAAPKAPRTATKHKAVQTTAIDTALRYATALANGDKITAGQLDFACQYNSVTAPATKATSSIAKKPSYDECWKGLTAGHGPFLNRSDIGMDVIWPSTGPLVFYGDTLAGAQASAFVMDVLGTSPPGTGLDLTVSGNRAIPRGSFRLKPNGPVIGVPATLVDLTIHYHDPLTSPIAYGPGTAHWTSTIKRERLAIKSMTAQWVVLSGLRPHGFPRDTAVVHLPVDTKSDTPGIVPERIPFTTEKSRALPDSITWWTPADQPGTLTAAAARAASFPELRDRVALLNRILLIDPQQTEALTVLTKNLYSVMLQDAARNHKLVIKDPILAQTVNEFYWTIAAASDRLDLSLGMEVGGFSQPTSADLLYRLLPALQTLARTHPEQLENRFRLGMAYRWNNDQVPMIETFEALVNDIPADRKSPKTEALLQLAWSRINKVAWNRILHDPDSIRAYDNAKASLELAERPLDKFLAEYAMAYSMIFMPNYGDKGQMLHHLTEAKRWFDDIPGKDNEIWRYFLDRELLKAVLDADPIFQPILATAEKPKE
jgi:hypothetical protein